ncbi:MAG: ParB/RepB/Spo0J family partition protein [Chloroflexota bacterium]|nr:ParB/RepB/Spo0J family partition protein [Chloroflexota bacterium]
MPASNARKLKTDKLRLHLLDQAGDWELSKEEEAGAAESSFDRLDRALMIPIERIAPMKDNPRQSFRHLDELAESIEDRGLIQPLVVRRDPDRPGYYMTVAGARRVMAANILRGSENPETRARVAALPCLVVDETDDQALASALAENLARDDLTRAEAMDAMLRLEVQYRWSGREIARRTGRNQADVAELLRVAKDRELNSLIREELISPTAAGEMSRLPTEIRSKAIEAVRAGQIRTVEDVRAVNPRRTRSARARAGQEANDIIHPPFGADHKPHVPVVNDIIHNGITNTELSQEASETLRPTPPEVERQKTNAEHVQPHRPLAGGRTSEANDGATVKAENQEEELRRVQVESGALRVSIEAHPILAWDPIVAADLAAIHQVADRVSGRRKSDVRVSAEGRRCLTHKLRLDADAIRAAFQHDEADPDSRANLEGVREILNELLD